MSPRSWLILGAAWVLIPAVAFAQPPGGGGFGRGGSEGRSRGMGDPEQFINMVFGDKNVVSLNDLDPRWQFMVERMMQSAGVTGNQISRDQFRDAMAKAREARERSGGMGGGFMGRPSFSGPSTDGSGPGGFMPRGDSSRGDSVRSWSPGGSGGGPGGPDAGRGRGVSLEASDAIADFSFRRRDTDGDGLLKIEEMPDDLIQERDKWDQNDDGFIDLNEYRAYMTARMQQRMAERDERGGGIDARERSRDGERGSSDPSSPPDEPDRRPVVFRAGKLPKELNPWFAKIDTNQDGQISLLEWRNSGRPIEEFKSMDRSGDNLLTIEEALLYVKLGKFKNATVSASSSGDFGMGFGPPGEFDPAAFSRDGSSKPGGTGAGSPRGPGGTFGDRGTYGDRGSSERPGYSTGGYGDRGYFGDRSGSSERPTFPMRGPGGSVGDRPSFPTSGGYGDRGNIPGGGIGDRSSGERPGFPSYRTPGGDRGSSESSGPSRIRGFGDRGSKDDKSSSGDRPKPDDSKGGRNGFPRR